MTHSQGAAPPKVTVLMSTYNRPEYLKDAIASVIRQELIQWELLVINDGGVDVGDIVSSFQDPRIRYIHRRRNRWKAACSNLGMQQARGEYIAYLDDDDKWYPQHLRVLADVLDQNPQIGAVYSDLYAVVFLKDRDTGQRYPLHKEIHVSRDFNRDFMFYYNHVLHVSLMHRKSLGLLAGGYDENITVLDDWNINRKLAFLTDFKYVPMLTGEYFIPVGKSDRNSSLEREDPQRFHHNMRKIKADLPPLPWPQVRRFAVIIPVRDWSEAAVARLNSLYDTIYYPCVFIIVNNTTEPHKACQERLGKLAELKNLHIQTPERVLPDLEAYYSGATITDADYLFLVSETLDPQVEFRLITANYLMGDKGLETLKWVEQPNATADWNVILPRALFLQLHSNEAQLRQLIDTATVIKEDVPPTLKCDLYFDIASKAYKNGNYKLAYGAMQEIESLKAGAVGEQYLVDLFAKICFELRRFDDAEDKCRHLIDRGYGADNWVRLGRVLEAKKDYRNAIKAYHNGLSEIGLKADDVNGAGFPVVSRLMFNSFEAFLGLGNCFLERKEITQATRMYRAASRIILNDHRPFMGFARLFLFTGDREQAEEALHTAEKRNAQDPRLHYLFGNLYEQQNRLEVAFERYNRSFELDKTDPQVIDGLFRTGSRLSRWVDLESLLTDFLEHRPANPLGIRRLVEVYIWRNKPAEAEKLLDKALLFQPENPELLELQQRLNKTRHVTSFR